MVGTTTDGWHDNRWLARQPMVGTTTDGWHDNQLSTPMFLWRVLTIDSEGVMMTSLFRCPSYPQLIVISGPSGVGKDTIARAIIEQHPDDFYFVVTATTRPPRAGEVNGVDYFFVSTDEFARMIEEGELLEHAIVYNDYKGIPKQQIRDALKSGRNVIMRVDVQGAATVRKLIPNALFVFLTTESEEELVLRLRERKSETPEGLNLRIATARLEHQRLPEFDYCVTNPDSQQERAVRQILSIVEAAQCRVEQSPILL